MIKRQRTIVGILLRETGHQLKTVSEQARLKLKELMDRVTQKKNKKELIKTKFIHFTHPLHIPPIK